MSWNADNGRPRNNRLSRRKYFPCTTRAAPNCDRRRICNGTPWKPQVYSSKLNAAISKVVDETIRTRREVSSFVERHVVHYNRNLLLTRELNALRKKKMSSIYRPLTLNVSLTKQLATGKLRQTQLKPLINYQTAWKMLQNYREGSLPLTEPSRSRCFRSRSHSRHSCRRKHRLPHSPNPSDGSLDIGPYRSSPRWSLQSWREEPCLPCSKSYSSSLYPHCSSIRFSTEPSKPNDITLEHLQKVIKPVITRFPEVFHPHYSCLIKCDQKYNE